MTQPMDDLTLPQPTHVGWSVDGVEPVYAYTADQLREYAKQAVEAEREACALVAEYKNAPDWSVSRQIAERIRARSQA